MNIIIRIPKSANIDFDYMQKLIDYMCYKELASKSEANDDQIIEIAREINQTWWQNNKSNFLQ